MPAIAVCMCLTSVPSDFKNDLPTKIRKIKKMCIFAEKNYHVKCNHHPEP